MSAAQVIGRFRCHSSTSSTVTEAVSSTAIVFGFGFIEYGLNLIRREVRPLRLYRVFDDGREVRSIVATGQDAKRAAQWDVVVVSVFLIWESSGTGWHGGCGFGRFHR